MKNDSFDFSKLFFLARALVKTKAFFEADSRGAIGEANFFSLHF
jgi:hypothetical protein